VLKQYASLKAATAEAIGTGISEPLKELLKYILEIGRAGQESFAGVFVKAIKDVIHWIWQIIIMWKVLGYRIADMGDALAPVKQFFFDLKDAAGDALTGVMILAVEVGKLFVAAFKPIQAFVSPIIKELGATAKDVLTAIADFIRPLIPKIEEGLTPAFSTLGKIVAYFIDIFGTGLGWIIESLGPFLKYIFLIIGAIKLWSIVQGILNAVMAINPIGAIIIAMVALIALAGLLIKNWDKVKVFFIAFGKKIAAVFTTLVNKIKQAFQRAVESIKAIWSAITNWFNRLWDGIVNTAMAVWNTLGDWFSGLVEGIKNIWTGIVGFFTG
jgi:phage-related protein